VLIKVVAIQALMGRPLTLEQKIHIFKQRPDIVCLPEYWLLDETVTDYQRAALRYPDNVEYLTRLSDELSTCLVGGTVVEPEGEKLFNTGFIFDRGRELGRYRKRFPVPGELEKGISAGDNNLVVEVEGLRVGVLICGDVFYPDLFTELRRHDCDLVVVPTTSRLREGDTVSAKRDRDRRYFIEGAKRASAYVCKVCGVGNIFGHALQGRSSFSAPWGMLEQVDFGAEREVQILSLTLDIDELREFRRRAQASLKAGRSALVDQ
jgi:predicted amidohydrolase